MGKDLRWKRPKQAFERFLVYPRDTSIKEILNHTKTARGSFRAVGVGNAVLRADEFGNVAKTQMKHDLLETTDRIDLLPNDLIYNTYAKEISVVVSWEEDELPTSLEFSTRPPCRKLITIRQVYNGSF